MVYTVLNDASDAQREVIGYYRSRLRILRSAIWNVPLVCVGIGLVQVRLGAFHWGWSVAFGLICALVFFAFRKMAFQYIGLIKGAHEVIANSEGSTTEHLWLRS